MPLNTQNLRRPLRRFVPITGWLAALEPKT